MFSLIYDNYEKDLKREIWLCHKNMNLSISEIENMPIRDRNIINPFKSKNKDLIKKENNYIRY